MKYSLPTSECPLDIFKFFVYFLALLSVFVVAQAVRVSRLRV